jgi:hypothetical protein
MSAPRSDDDAVRLLLAFLRDRDAPCPACGYNVRNLTAPECPECRHPLALTVGVVRPRMLWLLVTLAPSTFSGIAAGLLALPILHTLWTEAPGMVFGWVIAIDLFGWTSGAAGLGLIAMRFRFMSLPLVVQQLAAVATWALHVGVASTLFAVSI